MSETKDKAELVKKIIKAIEAVDPVKKEEKNQDLKYAFPSVDKMITAVRKAVIGAGVLMHIGEKQSIELAPGKTARGYIQYRHQVTITVELTDGSASFVGDFTGIAFDTSDKACSKAYTAAYKQALKQLFMIQTGDDVEPDATTPEPTMAQEPDEQKPQSQDDEHAKAKEAIAKFSDSTKKAFNHLVDKKSWTKFAIRVLVIKEKFDEAGVAMTLENDHGLKVTPNVAAINKEAAEKIDK